MSGNETIADICAEMRKMPNDVVVDMAAGFVFNRLADRIEAAVKRMAVPTPEQWTEFARQGSENETLKRDNHKLREVLRKLWMVAQNRMPIQKTITEYYALVDAENALKEAAK